MSEWNFGSLDKRQLTLRWFVPYAFSRFDGREFRVSPLRLLNLLTWFRLAFNRDSWGYYCCRHVGATHRCYCDNGSLVDGRVSVCGFVLAWFYSHYTGEIPCWCDKVWSEMEQETADV